MALTSVTEAGASWFNSSLCPPAAVFPGFAAPNQTRLPSSPKLASHWPVHVSILINPSASVGGSDRCSTWGTERAFRAKHAGKTQPKGGDEWGQLMEHLASPPGSFLNPSLPQLTVGDKASSVCVSKACLSQTDVSRGPPPTPWESCVAQRPP